MDADDTGLVTHDQNASGGGARTKVSRLLLALRIVLVLLLWLTFPVFMVVLLLLPFTQVGSGVLSFLIVPAFYGVLTAFICVARPHHRPTLVLGCVALGLVAAIVANGVYANSQMTIPGYDQEAAGRLSGAADELNLKGGYKQYRPFSSDAIARLDEAATLRFAADDGHLPRVDSATALLPLASSFVTATYPEEATTVGWEVDDPLDATFQYNNSSEGFYALVDGDVDVFFGAKPDEAQMAYAQEQGVEFEYTPVGREGFVFLVNAANPVSSLTVEQVKGIYSGQITNWKEVGGVDEPIIAYQRNQGSGSQSMMVRFMGDVSLADPPSNWVASGMGGLVSAVADYDNRHGAIGYSFRYYVTDLVGDYDVKLLAIEGVEPALEHIEDGTYPITGEFYATTRKGDDDANLARLLEWVTGEQGQELVEKSGYARLSR